MIMVVAPIQGILTDRFGGGAVVIASIPIFTISYALLYFLSSNLYACILQLDGASRAAL